jgi:ribonuclease E
MDEKRNNRSVERRLKDCLKHDRARIQVGRISHFGLLEMSRQRIRTSVLESSTEKCPYCGGSGHVRSVSSLALQVLRALEEQLMRGATHNLIARTRPDVALYVLNQKRAHLRGLEERFAITITISSDPTVTAPQAFVIDRGEQMHSIEAAKALAEKNEALAPVVEEEDDLEDPVVAEDEEAEDTEASSQPVAAEQGEGGGRRRRRRRRRSGRNGELRDEHHHVATSEAGAEFADDTAHGPIEGDDAHVDHQSREAGADESYDEQPAGEFAPREQRDGDEPRQNGERRRRRGRRGGRRNRNRNGEHGGYEQRGPQEHQGHDEGHVADYAAASDEPPSMPAHELIATPTTEPDLKAAVTDLDAAPPSSPPSPAPEAEPPRRRSTVRERAPIGSAGDASPAPTPPPAPAPVPEPVATSGDETAETDKPRRSGWWSRRFAGG